MKVEELIDILQCLDSDKEIVIIRPSKDYGRTHLAIPVKFVEHISIFWSDHHENFIIPESEEEKEKSITALVLV